MQNKIGYPYPEFMDKTKISNKIVGSSGYDMADLMKMNKGDLLDLAKGKNIEVAKSWNKTDISTAILDGLK